MSGPTREQAIKWAHESITLCGALGMLKTTDDDLARFAELAYAAGQAAERDECAKIADAESSIEGIAQRIASAIRARGQQ